MSKNGIFTNRETTTIINEKGEETTTIKETSAKLEPINEPDYIKIYTKMWCEFNSIPTGYQALFLELASRMSYCNTKNLENAQIVVMVEPVTSAVMQNLGWTSRDSLTKGLNALIKCNAIKRIRRSVYQINPDYAGRGLWKYNPKLQSGGIEDLIATFSFKDKEVKTKIIWADNGRDEELNEIYRKGLNTSKKDDTVLKTKNILNKKKIDS